MRRSAIVLAVLAAVSFAVGPVGAQSKAKKPEPIAAEARTKGKAEAPAALQASGAACTITDAVFRGTGTSGKGKDAIKVQNYEVACQEGLGFLVQQAPTKAEAFDCLAMKAASVYDAKGVLKSGIPCILPANLDAAAAMQPLVAKAGVACTVKDAIWIGFNATSNLNLYEVACQEGGGYFIDRSPTKVGANDCLSASSPTLPCKLTPQAEQIKVIAPYLAKAGKACALSDGRFVGQSTSGSAKRYYEAACSGAQGWMVEIKGDGSVRALDCVEASKIGGGCKLSDTSALVAQRAQYYVAALAPLGVTCANAEARVIGRETNGAMREVAELKCSDRPQGLIALVPSPGAKGEAAYDDCISVGRYGQQCELTKKADIIPVLNAAMKAHNRLCDVSDFRRVGPGETMDSDWIELACAAGQPGWVIDLPKTRLRPSRSLTCQGWKERGGEGCELPGNAGK